MHSQALPQTHLIRISRTGLGILFLKSFLGDSDAQNGIGKQSWSIRILY